MNNRNTQYYLRFCFYLERRYRFRRFRYLKKQSIKGSYFRRYFNDTIEANLI